MESIEKQPIAPVADGVTPLEGGVSRPRATADETHSATYWKQSARLWPTVQLAAWAAALLISFLWPKAQDVHEGPYRVVLAALLLFFAARWALGWRNRLLRLKVGHQAQLYTAVALLLMVWDILSTKTNTLLLPFFPGPAQILQVIVEDRLELLKHIYYSLRLLLVGFAGGLALGLGTGVLMGWYRQWGYWCFPALKVIGVIPATAWIPIAMVAFPSSFHAQIFLIVICVWFPVAYMTASGIQNIPNAYFEVARTLGANERFLITHVALPAAMPSIFTGVYTATGISFATLVVSEMVGAKAGLGFYINWAKGWANYAKVYAAIVIMAVIFTALMALVYRLRDRTLIWQKGLLK